MSLYASIFANLKLYKQMFIHFLGNGYCRHGQFCFFFIHSSTKSQQVWIFLCKFFAFQFVYLFRRRNKTFVPQHYSFEHNISLTRKFVRPFVHLYLKIKTKIFNVWFSFIYNLHFDLIKIIPPENINKYRANETNAFI